MNQGKDYKQGALMGAIAGIFSFGVGIYLVIDDYKYMTGYLKFLNISIMACILLAVVFAFAKLNKAAVGFIFGMFLFSALNYLKYFEDYNEILEHGLKSEIKLKADYRIYLICTGINPYVIYLLTILTLIYFILLFTTPNRKGMANSVTVFTIIMAVITLTALACYVSGNADYADRIKNFWVDVITHAVKAVSDMLMIIGISKAAAVDDVRMAGSASFGPQGGMYGIPYSNAPVNNAPYQMRSFNQPSMNYNQPQNMGYGNNMGSFRPQGGFGQQGYGQMNNNFGQQNMGGFGAQGGFGQQNMGGYISNQPQNSGGYPAQPQNGGYGQMNNNMNRFQPQGNYNQQGYGQMNGSMNENNGYQQSAASKPMSAPEMSSQSDASETSSIPGVPSDDINANASRDLSLYDKPDNL